MAPVGAGSEDRAGQDRARQDSGPTLRSLRRRSELGWRTGQGRAGQDRTAGLQRGLCGAGRSWVGGQDRTGQDRKGQDSGPTVRSLRRRAELGRRQKATDPRLPEPGREPELGPELGPAPEPGRGRSREERRCRGGVSTAAERTTEEVELWPPCDWRIAGRGEREGGREGGRGEGEGGRGYGQETGQLSTGGRRQWRGGLGGKSVFRRE